MRRTARARGAMVAAVAALLLVTAWVAAVDQTPLQLTTRKQATPIGATTRAVDDTLVSVDVTHAVIASVPAASRIADPRLGPVWALAALAAALSALAALRRRPDGSGIAAQPALLRGSVSRRAPPLVSFA